MKTNTTQAISTDHILRCLHCGMVQATADRMFRCHKCSELLEVVYPEWEHSDREFGLRLREIWRERRGSTLPEDASGVWRFRELLPHVESQHVVTMAEGNTPLIHLTSAARTTGVTRLLVKHQGLNPTGSFKDTGISMAISMARAEGFEFVCCASTGNTSASVAAYAARAGMKSIVLLPAAQVASGKLAQAIEYGAHVLQLNTDFDGCLKVLHEVVRNFPAYLLNSLNPYRLEGQKTVAFEIMEQLDWRVPDHVIVPGGNLANGSALGKGFQELHSLGLIAKLPRISIIQAAGANPLVRTMREKAGKELVRVSAETRATAIRIGNPASWRKAVNVLESTGGQVEDVTENEIADAKSELGAEGVGCEPASAATLAGLKKLVRANFVKSDETVVLVLTGHMLKDVDYMLASGVKRVIGPMAADAATVISTLERIHGQR
ncbi:MAG TPA: threonine synthase [Candidatus Angelobacter sp.]|nr:threonine synthase [Candidatus Angelobacter sp.]